MFSIGTVVLGWQLPQLDALTTSSQPSVGRSHIMMTALNGTGAIFKKCDRSNHRPDSNKNCDSGTYQHTCDSPANAGPGVPRRDHEGTPQAPRAGRVPRRSRAHCLRHRSIEVTHRSYGRLLPSAAAVARAALYAEYEQWSEG